MCRGCRGCRGCRVVRGIREFRGIRCRWVSGAGWSGDHVGSR